MRDLDDPARLHLHSLHPHYRSARLVIYINKYYSRMYVTGAMSGGRYLPYTCGQNDRQTPLEPPVTFVGGGNKSTVKHELYSLNSRGTAMEIKEENLQSHISASIKYAMIYFTYDLLMISMEVFTHALESSSDQITDATSTRHQRLLVNLCVHYIVNKF